LPTVSPGESFESCIKLVNELYLRENVTSILDHSSEELETEDALDENLLLKCRLIREVNREFPLGNVTFVPLKCTSLVVPQLLEKISEVIARRDNRGLTNALTVDDITQELSASEKRQFDSSIRRFSQVCEEALDANIRILLDAEQTHRQPAVELIARFLSQKYNQPDRLPVIYNTYQMYLQRTHAAIARDLELADEHGYIFAAKIVRGAYLKAETERAAGLGESIPLLPSKENTDQAYDEAINMLLNEIPTSASASSSIKKKKTSQSDNTHQSRMRAIPPAILIATHNKVSVEKAVAFMEEKGVARDEPRVHFAQILGMGDHLTYSLAHAGINHYRPPSYSLLHIPSL
jgi:hypothetical protein